MGNTAPAPQFPPTEEFAPAGPFGGPAGRLFDKALAEAGLDRRSLFDSNAVKHFSFESRTRDRGRALRSPLAPVVFATAHPSAILRAPDESARREAYRALVADLRIVAEALRSPSARRRRPVAATARPRQLSLLP